MHAAQHIMHKMASAMLADICQERFAHVL